MTAKQIDKDFERLAKGVFEGSIVNIDAALFQFTANLLMKSEFTGFGQSLSTVEWGTPEQHLLSTMQANTFWFSGAKTYSQLQTLHSLVTTEDGSIREWSDYKQKALDVHHLYNVNWLNAEYNHAIASSQMAGRWLDFQNTKATLPLLRFQTIGDDRVRPEHQSLDGITLPIDDVFWLSHYPPIGWRCRCDIIALRKGNVTDLTKRIIPSLSPFFAQNVGITGQVYPEGHPYYELINKDKSAATEVKKFVESELKHVKK